MLILMTEHLHNCDVTNFLGVDYILGLMIYNLPQTVVLQDQLYCLKLIYNPVTNAFSTGFGEATINQHHA